MERENPGTLLVQGKPCLESNGDFVEMLLEFFFPVRCAGCGKYDSRGLCSSCEKEVATRPMFFYIPGITGCLGIGAYAWPLREAVHELKFRNQQVVGKTLGEMLAFHVRNISWKVDGIVPVPMARNRRRERGFNQAAAIASGASSVLGAKLIDVLELSGSIRHQLGLRRKERFLNVEGVFKLKEKDEIFGKSLLLIDDVVTTGATLSACADVLKKGGALSLFAACVAVSAGGGPEVRE